MSRRIRQFLVLVAACAMLAAAFGHNHLRAQAHAESMASLPPAAPLRAPPSVAVVAVSAEPHGALLQGFGSAEPRYELALTARVSGPVKVVGEDFEPGNIVSRGVQLATLEDSAYRAAAAAAANTLASARVDYLQEQRERRQAQAEWYASGMAGEPESALVLRDPQLAAAQAAVDSAEAALAEANENLAGTHIRAPFEALVVTRSIAPGSYVQAGAEIGRLMSTDRVEIAIALSASDWAKLPDADTMIRDGWTVTLRQVDTAHAQWAATVVRAERTLESATRQRALIVAVDAPLAQTPALLPGTFVEASVPGRRIEGVWKLPASALTQRGEIWVVGADHTLARLAVEPLFADADAVYVKPPEALAATPQTVVLQPLSSYTEGMAATPVGADDDE